MVGLSLQVQVHTNVSPSLTTCKPVPVPSQRLTYQKMEERLAAARKTAVPSSSSPTGSAVSAQHQHQHQQQQEPASSPVVQRIERPDQLPRRTTLQDPNAHDIERMTMPNRGFFVQFEVVVFELKIQKSKMK